MFNKKEERAPSIEIPKTLPVKPISILMYGPFLRTNLRLFIYSFRVIVFSLKRLEGLSGTNQNAPNTTKGIDDITKIAS